MKLSCSSFFDYLYRLRPPKTKFLLQIFRPIFHPCESWVFINQPFFTLTATFSRLEPIFANYQLSQKEEENKVIIPFSLRQLLHRMLCNSSLHPLFSMQCLSNWRNAVYQRHLGTLVLGMLRRSDVQMEFCHKRRGGGHPFSLFPQKENIYECSNWSDITLLL